MDVYDFRPGGLTICGAPEGMDGLILSELADRRGSLVVWVARDDARMAAMREVLRFFSPGLEVSCFPAWDCLPYDRVSPRADISAQRLATLHGLATGESSGAAVLLTTVNAAIQRVPSREGMAASGWRVRAGNRVKSDRLTAFLEDHGYSRAPDVHGPGDYAVRGGIIDVFPPGLDKPVRLDLFGDTLESVRRFDPETQRSLSTEKELVLLPVQELRLDGEGIRRFRSGYVKAFGAVSDDPLYQAVSEGRRHMGMEHWLPLFHESLGSLFDYLPEGGAGGGQNGAMMCLDHLFDEAVTERRGVIDDYYRARQISMETDSEAASFGAPTYRPLPPESLFLTAAEWEAGMAGRCVRRFTPFVAGEGSGGAANAADVADAGGRRGRVFASEKKTDPFAALSAHLDGLEKAGKRAVMAAWSVGARERLGTVLAGRGMETTEASDWSGVLSLPAGRIARVVLGVESGIESADFAIISEQDILGDRLRRRPPPRGRGGGEGAESLERGELVVHIEHGVGRFEGLKVIDVSGAPHDCLSLTYRDGDRLLLPIENIDLLSRYGGAAAGESDGGERLDRLGSLGWQTRKARVRKRLRDMAAALMSVAADRATREGVVLHPPPGSYEEFRARFQFEETGDQQQAIDAVLSDLSSGRPMDRLVCGDVGFGKTEVALRAAFAAAMDGRQTMVVTPTTLLSRQHMGTFTERFRGWPVEVRQLSRFVSAGAAAQVRAGLESGQVDIVVGTHALLDKRVTFRDLGLLVIDEEQHFGVRHKERLKELKPGVHVLTLSATPIPRTLQLALSGARDLSLIATPPLDRLSVRSFVSPFDPVVVREALLREHYRGGQSFYVCPRIADLPEAEEFLKTRVPEVSFVTVHGRMPARQVEERTEAFYRGRCGLLLSTSIIESGLDIPSANTLIVHRADRFGLSQLHQLRGRVGRSKHRAYAWFTLPAHRMTTEKAQRRLKVLQSLESLGAGFDLASHDLDIRGAGNLLGEEQSGHVREVGYELYQDMLGEAIAAHRGDAEPEEHWSPKISLGVAVLIPEAYVPDFTVRVGLYRRLSRLEESDGVESFAAELIDRFGAIPDETAHLLEVVVIKILCRSAGVEQLDAGPKGAVLTFRGNRFADPSVLASFIHGRRGEARLRPDHKLAVAASWESPAERITGARALLVALLPPPPRADRGRPPGGGPLGGAGAALPAGGCGKK